MEFEDLLLELSFMKEIKSKVREKITLLEKQRYSSMDYDTQKIYCGYLSLEEKIEALIRADYDCEK